MSDVPWSMCMSAYLSVATPVCPAKTNELIRDAVWEADLCWPEEKHINNFKVGCMLATRGKYDDLTVRARR